jgi:Arylsulfotransferase (ASST)
MKAAPRRTGWWTAGAVALAALVAAVIISSSGGGDGGAGIHAQSGLAVLPFPGTPDASPASQIGFPTLTPRQLVRLEVRGSMSGRHSGHIVAFPGSLGASFVPDHPFVDREHVSVSARLSSANAGRSAGTHGAPELHFGFGVAAPLPAHPNPAALRPARQLLGRTQVFHSRPDLQPPLVTVSGSDPDPRSGDIFLDAQAVQQNGPEILDSQGHLLWFAPLNRGQQAFDVQLQHYRGQPVITYFEGQLVGAHGVGEDVILDRSYRKIATVHAGAGYQADLHEFLLTRRGTALITSYVPVRADLSSVGGSRDGRLLDCLVQEIDVATGQVLWEWHALGHVPITDTEQRRPHPGSGFDYFHINSIQEAPDGNLIISARNTWAVYEVSRRTGKIIWELGGKRSSFKQGRGVQFEWQHDARLTPAGTLTLFNNAGTPREERQSSALTLKLDTGTMKASLVRRVTHSPPVMAGSQGNVQPLSGGNTFVGWGSEPFFSEYDATGRQVFDARFPRPTQSYRAFRYPWVGQPNTSPDVSVLRTGTGVTAYVSWNGATEVASWEMVGGSSPTALHPLLRAPRSGFETTLSAPSAPAVIAVRALDRSGQVLGTSSVVAG